MPTSPQRFSTRRGFIRVIASFFGLGAADAVAAQQENFKRNIDKPRANPLLWGHAEINTDNFDASDGYNNWTPAAPAINKESVLIFATLDQATTARLSPDVATIQVTRYTIDAPICPAFYRRLPSEKAAPGLGRVMFEDKSWWELAETVICPEMFGARGDNTTDDTIPLQAALDFGSRVKLKSTYAVSRSITLRSTKADGYGFHLSGDSSHPDRTGVRLTNPSASCLFTSSNASDGYLSGVTVENLRFLGPGVEAGSNLHCFKIFGLTNNSTFRNVLIQHFSGNGLDISKNNSRDPTACGNVVFSQLFCTAIGKFAFRCDGRINATFIEPDFSRVGGGFYLSSSDGPGLAQCSVIGLWYEGDLSQKVAVVLENMANTPVSFFGATFDGPQDATDIVQIRGATRASVSFIGCSQNGFKAWIRDEVNEITVDVSSVGRLITYVERVTSGNSLLVRGRNPALELQRAGSPGIEVTTTRLLQTDHDFRIEMTGGATPQPVPLAVWSLQRGDLRLSRHGKALAPGGIGVGNTAPANMAGNIIKKMPIFDSEGNQLGFIPIYDAIS